MFTLILVDDEPWALSGLRNCIDWKCLGFDVIQQCLNGSIALEKIKELHPDAAVVDIRMPNISGIGIIEECRKLELATEFIIVSAYEDFEIARKAINSSVVTYLLKPLDKAEVYQSAVTLKNRLEEKRNGRKYLHNDMEGWKATTASLQWKYIGVSSDPAFQWPKDNVVIQKTTKHQSGWSICCFASDQRLEKYFQEVGTARYSDCRSIGASLAHSDFNEEDAMFAEAYLSLKFEFTYSENVKVSLIEKFIAENFQKELSLSVIANKFSISETYLCDLFKKHSGMTVIEFITSIRMKQSVLLMRSGLTPQEISEKVGYEHYGHFAHIFKRQFDTSPRAFMNSL